MVFQPPLDCEQEGRIAYLRPQFKFASDNLRALRADEIGRTPPSLLPMALVWSIHTFTLDAYPADNIENWIA